MLTLQDHHQSPKRRRKKMSNSSSSEVSSQFPGGPIIPTTAANDDDHPHHQNRASSDDERRPADQTTTTSTTASSENPATNPCLETTDQQGLDIIINDAANFTTPTSSDHKIPSPKHCPPAPRKPSNSQPPPPPGHLPKRKGSPSSHIPFRDLDLFFIDQQLQGDSRKLKKPRTHHHDHDNNNKD